ncbi:MAG: acetyl-CoA carboxylase, carboxyltransferase subunit beta [Defluviitaleaceae bacterium]|nr:acetyl-CoA carboxylase, carboxyltransferase subunit beta [Defluviitaleaceae bacterium]
MIFKKPKNTLEGHGKFSVFSRKNFDPKNFDEELSVECLKCKKSLSSSELADTVYVCPYCRYHFLLSVRRRLDFICDKGSFTEFDSDLTSSNIIGFPNYEKKLRNAKMESSEQEAVVCGKCTINGLAAAVFVMNPYFMMGSMGTVVGEKITRLFEYATEKNLPVVGFTVSGGARMQEGILSLMQMAKISGAVKLHSDAGNLYFCVLTDPTMGGVTASFAMQADIIIAEPFARIGFAGPRVIEQTTGKKLPDGFQSSAFLLQKGFVDDVIDRRRHKRYISRILKLHAREVAQ